jgi:hypothetical protein
MRKTGLAVVLVVFGRFVSTEVNLTIADFAPNKRLRVGGEDAHLKTIQMSSGFVVYLLLVGFSGFFRRASLSPYF